MNTTTGILVRCDFLGFWAGLEGSQAGLLEASGRAGSVWRLLSSSTQ